MKMRIDRDADVLWIEWGETSGSEVKEIGKHVYLHVSPAGEPVALEVLFVGKRTGQLPDRLLLEYFPEGSSAQEPPAKERMSIEFGAAVRPWPYSP